tara:strand:- start:55 stop:225 length:171 start_codon:yes stop_codon:yes gene_type:complete
MGIIIIGIGVLFLVAFVGFWGLYGGLAMWKEFVDPLLAQKRKDKERRETWNEYDDE